MTVASDVKTVKTLLGELLSGAPMSHQKKLKLFAAVERLIDRLEVKQAYIDRLEVKQAQESLREIHYDRPVQMVSGETCGAFMADGSPMVYEERVMDGKLWCRNGPGQQWTSVPYEVVMGRMLLAEKQLAAVIKSMQPRGDYVFQILAVLIAVSLAGIFATIAVLVR